MLSGAFAIYAASEPLPSIQHAIQTAFNWILGIAGILAAMSFAAGAVQYIISDHANGRERMLGSVLGLALIFTSVIILKTINPKLTNLSLQGLPAGPGIFYVKGQTKAPAPMEEKDTTKVVGEGYTGIEYTCIANTTSVALLIWQYLDINFENPILTYRLGCGDSIPIYEGTSFKIAFETPGVYFFSEENCEGFSSTAFTTSQSPLPSPWAGNVKSARLVAPPANLGTGGIGSGLGVIFHQDPRLDYGGPCGMLNTFAPTSTGAGERTIYVTECIKNIGDNLESVNSVDIVFLPENINTSGEGVSFFSEEEGWQATAADGMGSGRCDVLPRDIPLTGKSLSAENMEFDWSKTKRDNVFREIYKTFEKRQGSVKIDGNYLVALYSVPGRESSNEPCTTTCSDPEEVCTSGKCKYEAPPDPTETRPNYYCQSFRSTVNNLGAESYSHPDYHLNDVKILPIMPL